MPSVRYYSPAHARLAFLGVQEAQALNPEGFGFVFRVNPKPLQERNP